MRFPRFIAIARILTITLGLAWASLSGIPRLFYASEWNLANLSYVSALTATRVEDVYYHSTQAAHRLRQFSDKPNANSRLATSYQMLWRSSSALELSTIALTAYSNGRALMGEPSQRALCAEVSPSRLEAEDFFNISPGGSNRIIELSAGRGVLLFTNVPISQTLCLDTPGIYTLTVAVVEGTPPPIEIEVGWNGWPVEILQFSQGNERIGTKELRVATPPGENVLYLRFENDFFDPIKGVDRNAIIDFVDVIGH